VQAYPLDSTPLQAINQLIQVIHPFPSQNLADLHLLNFILYLLLDQLIQEELID
jgi:hypothetical protein